MAANSSYTRMFPVSWEELHRHCKALAWRLTERPPFKGLIGITRGGLVPAAIVARELDLRLVETVCCSAYNKLERTGTVTILKPPAAALEDGGAGWLLIDDLVDTGITAKAVRALLPKAHFAAIYAKPAGRPLVDTFVTEVSQDTWILFPWDQETTMSKPIVELKNGGSPT
jgi:xanthine phosphoribosyltransferase